MEDPEETEHVMTAELLNSIRLVWFTLIVTFETVSVEEGQDQDVYKAYCTLQSFIVGKQWRNSIHTNKMCAHVSQAPHSVATSLGTTVQSNAVQYNSPAIMSIFTGHNAQFLVTLLEMRTSNYMFITAVIVKGGVSPSVMYESYS